MIFGHFRTLRLEHSDSMFITWSSGSSPLMRMKKCIVVKRRLFGIVAHIEVCLREVSFEVCVIVYINKYQFLQRAWAVHLQITKLFYSAGNNASFAEWVTLPRSLRLNRLFWLLQATRVSLLTYTQYIIIRSTSAAAILCQGSKTLRKKSWVYNRFQNKECICLQDMLRMVYNMLTTCI